MRAIVKPSVHSDDLILKEVPIPEVGDEQFLIRVHAIGVGIHDGYFFPPTVSYPYIIGIEASGTIEALGNKVSTYQVAQRVTFISSMQVKGGTWAEYAVVDESSLIVPIPSGMTFVEAAAIPVAAGTALKAFHALQLQPKESLFIAGASGAIGGFAIQIATGIGCLVAASASAKNHAFMRGLGASLTVDYHDPDWAAQVRAWMPGGVDAVLAIPPGTTKESLSVAKDGGRVVAVSGDQVESERGIQIHQIPHNVDVFRELKDLMERIVKRDMNLEIEEVYKFDDFLKALQKTQTRHARGKIVIEVL